MKSILFKYTYLITGTHAWWFLSIYGTGDIPGIL